MRDTLAKDALELLTKENERYRLESLGFFRSLKEEAASFAEEFPREESESFTDWRHRSLQTYYRIKGFGRFCRDRFQDPQFERMIKGLLNAHLFRRFTASERTSTDIFLAPDNSSVSYCLPPEIFNELYSTYFSAMPVFGNTDELDTFCRKIIAENFPTEEAQIIERMKANCSTYWERFYLKLKPITAAFSYQISNTYGENNIHDIWSDTCILVNQAVTEGRMKDPVDARAIISYAVGVIKNKNRELNRRKSKAPVDVDTLQYRLTAEEENKYFNKPETAPENFPSQIETLRTYIDYSDPESVQGYFVVVLYNKEHPLHRELVKGYEDKVEKMMEHYVDGLSYEEIVAKHSGPQTGKALVKECARLRQEIKRLKKNLTDRFSKIMEQYK